MKAVKEIKQEMLNDLKVKAEYERLEPQFRLVYILIEARSRAGLSQEALAERMGMKQATYVAFWEEKDKKIKIIEVIYVGTHEKAPY